MLLARFAFRFKDIEKFNRSILHTNCLFSALGNLPDLTTHRAGILLHTLHVATLMATLETICVGLN